MGMLGDAWLSDFAEVAVGGLLKLADLSPVCVRGCADRLALLASSSCHRMAAARERSAWVICNMHAGEAYCSAGEGFKPCNIVLMSYSTGLTLLGDAAALQLVRCPTSCHSQLVKCTYTQQLLLECHSELKTFAPRIGLPQWLVYKAAFDCKARSLKAGC